jgi:magnesium transporter
MNGSPANNFDSLPNGLTRYSIVVYDAGTIDTHECAGIDEVLSRVQPGRVNWITVRDVHDKTEILRLLNFFQLDSFLLHEILDENLMQFETEYENCLYLEYVVPHFVSYSGQLEPSKGSFILGRDFLILYEHDIHGLFGRTRRRILGQQTKAKRYGPDYLLYLLLRAAVVEHYQITFKRLTRKLEELEDYVLASEGREDVFQDILAVREEVKPWNEPLLELEDFLEFVKDAESQFISDETARQFTKFLIKEVHDLLDYYDRLHLWMKEVMDLHMANVSRSANRVTQLLTVIATIFLPLTFISSVYGMNFRYMPELEWRFGYLLVLLLMLTVALGLIAFMKRRGWF